MENVCLWNDDALTRNGLAKLATVLPTLHSNHLHAQVCLLLVGLGAFWLLKPFRHFMLYSMLGELNEKKRKKKGSS